MNCVFLFHRSVLPRTPRARFIPMPSFSLFDVYTSHSATNHLRCSCLHNWQCAHLACSPSISATPPTLSNGSCRVGRVGDGRPGGQSYSPAAARFAARTSGPWYMPSRSNGSSKFQSSLRAREHALGTGAQDQAGGTYQARPRTAAARRPLRSSIVTSTLSPPAHTCGEGIRVGPVFDEKPPHAKKSLVENPSFRPRPSRGFVRCSPQTVAGSTTTTAGPNPDMREKSDTLNVSRCVTACTWQIATRRASWTCFPMMPSAPTSVFHAG